MTQLADIDRPPVAVPFPPWDRDVVFRTMGAAALLRFQSDWTEALGDQVDAAITARFYADLLAATCIDPAATADEWLEQVQADTLVSLGFEALKVCGMTGPQLEEKKSESNDHSVASPSPCAENSESPTPTNSTTT